MNPTTGPQGSRLRDAQTTGLLPAGRRDMRAEPKRLAVMALLAGLAGILPGLGHARQSAGAPPPAAGAPVAPSTDVAEEVITPQQIARWEMNLGNIAQECTTLLSEDLLPECYKRLDAFGAELGDRQHPEVDRLRESLRIRRQLIDDTLKLPKLDPEKPDPYYRALFQMYLRVPEAFFPYDEVRPFWQQYLLLESSQQRFKKYKTVRVLSHIDDPEDKALDELFNRYIQNFFLDYGFKLVDLTTTAPQGERETLVKINLAGEALEGVADAALGQTPYELTGDITSIRYTGPGGEKLPPRSFKLVETSIDAETAMDQAAKRLAPQVADAVFYLTLKQMFPS